MILNGKAICIEKLNELRDRQVLITLICEIAKAITFSQANKGNTRITRNKNTVNTVAKKEKEKVGHT